MTRWNNIKSSREVRVGAETVIQKEFDGFTAYQNCAGWMNKVIFTAEMRRFSKHLERVDPGKKHLILVDNFRLVLNDNIFCQNYFFQTKIYKCSWLDDLCWYIKVSLRIL